MRVASNVLVLCVVALVFCAPLYRDLRSVDAENDEAIYSYAVDSILDTGDWPNPRSSPTPNEAFLEKPPLKFWIVALPIRLGLLPRNDLGMRFWDATFGSLTFLYVFVLGRRMAGWSGGAAALLTLYSLDWLIFSHGLRGNNMEAAVVLAYAGGIYHFLRWAESEKGTAGTAHAVAVGGYFLLAFMTKFVAAAFLPMMLGAASLEVPSTRAKALAAWRTWLAIGAGVLALAAPWFVYQTIHTMNAPRSVWSIMLAEHVVKRFQSSLDPSHVHPWYFYFQYLGGALVNTGMIWPVVLGAALIHRRVFRGAWLDGTLVLYWFWLPFVLMSFGSSKLWHYAYPFLAPVCLASGYAVGSVSDVLVRIVGVVADPARARRFTVPAWLQKAGAALRPWWPWIQGAVLAVCVIFLAAAAYPLLFTGRIHVLSLRVRPPVFLPTVLSALLVGVLVRRAAWMARLALPLVLLAFMPIDAYQRAVQRTEIQDHPLRSSSECLASVQAGERAAGRPVRPMYVYLPDHTFNHAFFYYYQPFGWDRHDGVDDAALLNLLDDPAEQRPVLMPDDKWQAIRAAHDSPETVRRSAPVSRSVRLLLPGPYGSCGS